MYEKQKILAVETAIREHADWAATDSATILWSMVDNISFSEDNKIVRARWKAKLVFIPIEQTGIEGTSIPKNVIYEEEIVELMLIDEDTLAPAYFVSEWGVKKDAAHYIELSWDDEEITHEDIELFCRWQDTDALRDELIKRFRANALVNLDLFPKRLRFFLKNCLDSSTDL